jgi:hypothetical protein
MAYNEDLDMRITGIVSAWGAVRKKMFGGTCHLINGNMLCGVYQDYLVVRLGPEGAAAAVKGPRVKSFDITGRPMKGWVMVEEAGFQGPALERWLLLARQFAETLPPK